MKNVQLKPEGSRTAFLQMQKTWEKTRAALRAVFAIKENFECKKVAPRAVPHFARNWFLWKKAGEIRVRERGVFNFIVTTTSKPSAF